MSVSYPLKAGKFDVVTGPGVHAEALSSGRRKGVGALHSSYE